MAMLITVRSFDILFERNFPVNEEGSHVTLLPTRGNIGPGHLELKVDPGLRRAGRPKYIQ
jgi:hypothetical protein